MKIVFVKYNYPQQAEKQQQNIESYLQFHQREEHM